MGITAPIFLPSWFLLRSSAITVKYSDKHTLTTSVSAAVSTRVDVKEQPLLRTCRSFLLSFVFGRGLSTVTTQPSPYPCIDIATDVISDCCEEKGGM